MNDYDDYDEYEPPIRSRSRRDRLINEMPEHKFNQRRTKRDHESKPKGFKHNRKRNQKNDA